MRVIDRLLFVERLISVIIARKHLPLVYKHTHTQTGYCVHFPFEFQQRPSLFIVGDLTRVYAWICLCQAF